MKYLLVIPPLTQLNTPYPSTALLKGFLEQHGHAVAQLDLGIELIDALFQRASLEQLAESVSDPDARQQLLLRASCIDAVMRFLRGSDNTLAPRIANRSFLPEGPRFNQLTDLEWAFGTAGVEDRARHLATLFIEETADLLRDNIDPHFDLIRYAEQLSSFADSFDELQQALDTATTPIEQRMLSLFEDRFSREKPDIVGFSIPFPGCLLGALRCCQYLRGLLSSPTIVLGGGFVNTELRSLQDPQIFDYCDFITLDDGEEPLLRIADFIGGGVGEEHLLRTFLRTPSNTVSLINPPTSHSHASSPNPPSSNSDADSSTLNSNLFIHNSQPACPDFSGLPFEKYLSLAEMANPMHRLWSQGRWNKMMMAHGCYWHRCAFCDTSLDYIGNYFAPSASTVVDHMERIVQQTGISGFHFVDEALPPKLLEEVSREILRRGISVSFWGNIRFEKAYSQELCDLLADAGCVAVSGGLEVASDRLLHLMSKGVTVRQTIDACRHFRNAGIMVHTYLMYGFPTETLQESLDALENVRRMFDEGIVQSAFWHRYAMTCHSSSGLHPESVGARRTSLQPHPFCNNEVDWLPMEGDCQFDYDIDELGRGLRLATYNYMNDFGIDQPVRSWFPNLKLKSKPSSAPSKSSPHAKSSSYTQASSSSHTNPKKHRK